MSAPEPGRDRPVVLVADDSATTRALYRTVLSAAGYDVVEAVDGVEALARLASSQVSLVVLDSNMPRLDGLGVIRGLRSVDATARLPVIMVTGEAEEADRVRGLDLGADDYLAKPVSTKELVARVRAHIRLSDS